MTAQKIVKFHKGEFLILFPSRKTSTSLTLIQAIGFVWFSLIPPELGLQKEVLQLHQQILDPLESIPTKDMVCILPDNQDQ